MSAYERIYSETRAIIAADETLSRFAGDLPSAPDFADLPARPLPHVGKMAALASLASPQTQKLTDEIIRVAPDLHWQQSYTVEQVGNHYLENYGWFNLVSPQGPVRGDIRLSFGFWSQDLFYPRHWHAPEELYFVIAGGAIFQADGDDDAELSAGMTRYPAPNQPHAMHMTNAPLLAFAIWRGDALSRNPDMEQRV